MNLVKSNVKKRLRRGTRTILVVCIRLCADSFVDDAKALETIGALFKSNFDFNSRTRQSLAQWKAWDR